MSRKFTLVTFGQSKLVDFSSKALIPYKKKKKQEDDIVLVFPSYDRFIYFNLSFDVLLNIKNHMLDLLRPCKCSTCAIQQEYHNSNARGVTDGEMIKYNGYYVGKHTKKPTVDIDHGADDIFYNYSDLEENIIDDSDMEIIDYDA